MQNKKTRGRKKSQRKATWASDLVSSTSSRCKCAIERELSEPNVRRVQSNDINAGSRYNIQSTTQFTYTLSHTYMFLNQLKMLSSSYRANKISIVVYQSLHHAKI